MTPNFPSQPSPGTSTYSTSNNLPSQLPTKGDDQFGTELTDDWRDDPRYVAMYLAVLHLGFSTANPKATPPSMKALLDTADQIYRWLT